MMKLCGLALALSLSLVGCAGSTGRPEFPEQREDEPPMIQTPSARLAPAPEKAGLSRQKLNAVLDQGPAVFLQGVRVRAQKTGDGFGGWEILSLDAADGRFARVDLGPGDVVTKINGRSVERPEQFSEVFESLRAAPELVVEYRRHGELRELRFPIVE
jgi:type II secretory pathway component PulC